MKQTHHIGYVQTPSVKNLSNVKNALVENGLVPLTTPNEMLPDAIEKGLENLKPENVRGNVKIGNVTGTIATTWDEVDTENLYERRKAIVDFDFSIYHTNGIDIYGGYKDSEKAGIYHVNSKTYEKTKIYSGPYAGGNGKFYFKQDSKGNIYVSASSGYKGLIHLKGLVATQIYSSSYYWEHWFEDSKGNLYASGNVNGVYYINGTTINKIYSTGVWKTFFESTNGNVYCGGGSSNTYGILKLTPNNAIQIYAYGKYWGTDKRFYEARNGNIYVSTSDFTEPTTNEPTGVLCILTDGSTIKIFNKNGAWGNWYEDTKGNIYASPNLSAQKGLIRISNLSVEELSTDAGNWVLAYEGSEENLYFTSSFTDSGIILVTNKSVQKIYDLGYNWNNFTQYDNNTLYVTSNSSPRRILMIKNKTEVSVEYEDTYEYDICFKDKNNNLYFSGGYGILKKTDNGIKKIYSSYQGWDYWFEDHKGNLFVGSSQQNGLLHIDGETVTRVYNRYSWTMFITTPQGVIASQTEKFVPDSIALLLDGTDVYEIKL